MSWDDLYKESSLEYMRIIYTVCNPFSPISPPMARGKVSGCSFAVPRFVWAALRLSGGADVGDVAGVIAAGNGALNGGEVRFAGPTASDCVTGGGRLSLGCCDLKKRDSR